VLRLAREYNLLPCEYIGQERDPEIDFLFTMALDIHDKELLCQCGDYREDCQTGDGWYEIADDQICYKQAALEEFRKDNDDLEPGTMLQVVDLRREQAPSRTQHHTKRTQSVPGWVEDDSLG